MPGTDAAHFRNLDDPALRSEIDELHRLAISAAHVAGVSGHRARHRYHVALDAALAEFERRQAACANKDKVRP